MTNQASLQHIGSIIADFGSYIGLPDLRLDEDGRCVLSFDDSIVSLEHEDMRGALLLRADIGEVPPHADRSFFRRLLNTNRASMELGTGTIGIDGDRMMWLDRIPAEGLTQEVFQAQLQSGLDRIEFWKGYVSAPQAEDFGTETPMSTLAADLNADPMNQPLILRP